MSDAPVNTGKKSIKMCEVDSLLEWHKHSGLSVCPITNLCSLREDLPTLILVNSEFVCLFPFAKCFYLLGFISCLINDLKSFKLDDLTFFGSKFHNLE